MSKASLKTQNIVPLGMLTIFVLSVAVLVTQGKIAISSLPSLVPAAETIGVVSVVAVWASYLIPAELKHVFIFLKITESLPGHRFIQLCEKDPRVDLDRLKSCVGDMNSKRSDASWQNRFWYNEMYRPVKDAPEVASAHKSFLLYRDATIVTLISFLAIAIGQVLMPGFDLIIDFYGLVTIGVFALLFLCTANNAGNRFVKTSVSVYLSQL